MADTVIDFIRHGEPVGGRCYRGNGVDDPLSETGWVQMWSALGDSCPWDEVISSPLQRCHAFARELGERHKRPVHIDDRFREVGFGSWEGRTPEQILASNADEYHAFHEDPLHQRPDGAEPLEAFGKRVAEGLNHLSTHYAGKHLLVVAHAGVIRAALGHVLKADPAAWYRTRIDNAGLTRFRYGAQGVRLEFHNRVGLPEAGITSDDG